MTDNNEPLPPAGRSGHLVSWPKSGESARSGHPAGQQTGHYSRVPVPEAVLSCGAAKVALWLYARGYDLYAVKTELRAYGFGDARYFADLMRDGPDGACELAKVEAGRAGNRDAAKAVRCLLPSRDDWREWTGTQTARQKQRYARSARDAEMIAYYAYLHAVDRPGVIATDPVAGLLYGAGIGLPRQPEGSAVQPYSRVELDRGAANRNTDRKECGLVVVFRSQVG